jgi:hypothetical protein
MLKSYNDAGILNPQGGLDLDDMDKELDTLLERSPNQASTPWQNANLVRVMVLLTKSVRTLDSTSSRLAKIYIWLTVVLGIIGIVQIILMLRGH